MNGKNVKIISDGTTKGSKVLDSNGKEIKDVTSATWELDSSIGIAIGTITLNAVPFDCELTINDPEYKISGLWFGIDWNSPLDIEVLLSNGKDISIGTIVTAGEKGGNMVLRGGKRISSTDYPYWMPLPAIPDKQQIYKINGKET